MASVRIGVGVEAFGSWPMRGSAKLAECRSRASHCLALPAQSLNLPHSILQIAANLGVRVVLQLRLICCGFP